MRNEGTILGIEGGGTRTTWAKCGPDGVVLQRGESGPGNTLLLDDSALENLLRTISRAAGTDLTAIGAAFAGCQQPEEKARVEKAVRSVWPHVVRVEVMEDTRSVLAAAFGDGPGLVIIAGTGSNVAGQRNPRSPIKKAGGWGHLFADRGSAYDLARRGLEAAYEQYDATRRVGLLGQEFLAAVGARTLEEAVPALLRDTGKTAVAQLAPCVFAAAQKGDRDAGRLLEEAVLALAQKAITVARRLRMTEPRIALTGGLFENQPGYRTRFERALRKLSPRAKALLLTTPGVIGAARVAGLESAVPAQETKAAVKPVADSKRLAAFAAAATEQRNPRSRGLDRRTIPQLVDLFIREERHVDRALAGQRGEIARAAELVARRMARGGRLIYVGAGTSGRLGVVDASEMPPTFNASPEEIQAIMAGGPGAVFRSREGAEDNREAGAAEVRLRRLTSCDVVCGIAASGQTPFVLGAIEAARKKRAATILLSCNPRRTLREPVDVAIDLATGPELVTGSTRLKAGTATKLVLNILSTVAMIRLGRVSDNLMVNVQATNDKLRARAIRLVEALAGCPADRAQAALEAVGWRVPAAVAALRGRKAARG